FVNNTERDSPCGEEDECMTQTQNTKVKKTSASIVWLELPADDPERAKKFYGSLFGWKIEKFGGADDYWHIDTEGADETPDGGLMRHKHPQQSITNYVAVSSVDESTAKVEQLGGTLCKSKTAI